MCPNNNYRSLIELCNQAQRHHQGEWGMVDKEPNSVQYFYLYSQYIFLAST